MLTAQARLFIAIPLHHSIRPIINEWCQQIKVPIPFKKWVHPADYHITVKYLGDTSFTKAKQVKEKLNEIVQSFSPFELSIEGVGTFGRPTSPRVLWGGVGGQLSSLNNLYNQTEAAMTSLDYPIETRPYHPHLTIARQFAGEVPFLQNELSTVFQPKEGRLTWTVKEVVLFQTHFTREPMYQPLSIFPFELK